MLAKAEMNRRLGADTVKLLCGAMGTEIQRRGVRTDLPFWSADGLLKAPEVVQKIHADYLEAGAEILTTNTFRTNLRTFKSIGKPELARELTLKASELALDARSKSGKGDVLIGGSIAPVEDCYRPDLAPSNQELKEEHGVMLDWFEESGVDFIFAETHNSLREASAITEECARRALPFMISFVCKDGTSLLSEEPIKQAVEQSIKDGAIAILANCRPLETIDVALKTMLAESSMIVGAYGNGEGHPDDVEGWKFEGENPEEKYLIHVKQWIEAGALIVGGCCGTTPDYTRRMREYLDDRNV